MLPTDASELDATEPTAVRSSGTTDWRPLSKDHDDEYHPWDEKAYQDLRKTIKALPPTDLRDLALENIRRLDCAIPTLGSCDYLPPPVGAAAWQRAQQESAAWKNEVEKARVDDVQFKAALAAQLKAMVCSSDDHVETYPPDLLEQALMCSARHNNGASGVERVNFETAVHIVRGKGFQDRLEAAGPAATHVIDGLLNKDSKNCPVSAAIVDADRARLLQLKQRIETATAPQKTVTSDAPYSP